MYSGGIDTVSTFDKVSIFIFTKVLNLKTVGAVRTFFLMMAKCPDIQRKAQAEIDSVIGHDRLANMDDRENLPYVNRLIVEVLRFNPIAPIVPHSLNEDDVSSILKLLLG